MNVAINVLLILSLHPLILRATYDGDYTIIDIPCDNDFVVYKSKCYKVVKSDATYATAVYVCKALHKAKLFEITEPSEQEMLRAIATGVMDIKNNLWIRGSSYTSKEGVLCTLLPINGSRPHSENCNRRHSFVCEKPRKDESRYKDYTVMEQMASGTLDRLEEKLAGLQDLVLRLVQGYSGGLAGNLSSGGAFDGFTPFPTCAAPPLVLKTPEVETLTVEVGEALNVTCDAYGNPRPNVTWTIPVTVKNGSVNVTASQNGLVLTIKDVQSYHKGNYVCIAENGIGNSVQERLTVEVLHAPKTYVFQERISENGGDKVKLSCLVDAYPSAEAVWYNNATKEILNYGLTQLNGTFALLEYNITRFERDRLGPYFCYAKNDYGESSAEIYALITPYNVSIEDAEETELGLIQLKFTASSFYRVEAYKLMYQSNIDRQSNDARIASTPQVPEGVWYSETYSIPTTPGRKYQARLFAKNEFGWSDSSPVFEFNSTFVCGQNLTAGKNWRHLVSHERYGVDTLHRYFKCRTFVFCEEGLEIEFYDVDSKVVNYPMSTDEGRDLKTFLIADKHRNYFIYSPKSLLIPGKAFEIFARATTDTSRGFAARLREAKRDSDFI